MTEAKIKLVSEIMQEKDEEIAKKDALLAEKDNEIAEKDAEIAELKVSAKYWGVPSIPPYQIY